MVDTFDCPKCGAPIQYNSADQGDLDTTPCPYCGESIIIPAKLHHHPPTSRSVNQPSSASQHHVTGEEDRTALEELAQEYKAQPYHAATFGKPKDSGSSFNSWFKWVFMAIGLICLALGVKNFLSEKALIATYEPVTAKLSDLQLDPSSKYKSSLSYCAHYKYTTKEGETRVYTTRDCTNNPNLAAFGTQKILLYYNPRNPDADVIDTGWLGEEYDGLDGGIIGFVFFALIWAIWAVGEWAGARSKRRKALY